MDEFQLKLLKNGCDWKVGETVSEPPIQFSLQPGSHSRIMSWALSRQSPHLSLEQFNISLELLKNKRDLSAVRLGPEKWLRQKIVEMENNYFSHHIWDETENWGMVLPKFSDRKRWLVKSSASMGRSDIEWKSCCLWGGTRGGWGLLGWGNCFSSLRN